MLLADAKTVMPVDHLQVLVDDDGRVAAVLEKVGFQIRKLLVAQRREQLGKFRQHGGRAFLAGVYDSGILHVGVLSLLLSRAVLCGRVRGCRSSFAFAGFLVQTGQERLEIRVLLRLLGREELHVVGFDQEAGLT